MRLMLAITLAGAILTAGLPARAEVVAEGAPLWPVAQTLIANERTAWDVYFRRDTAAPDLLSDDYVDMLADGAFQDRTAHLAAIADSDLVAYDLKAFQVIRLSDDAMLVSYEATWSNAHETGRVAITSGWAIRDGDWKNVFYRETSQP